MSLGAPAPERPCALYPLKQRSQFLQARKGRTARRSTLVVQAVRRPLPTADAAPPRHPIGAAGYGVTATKKTGHSPRRSRAKRRMRELARALLPEFGLAGCDYVLIARARTAAAPWDALQRDARAALIEVGKGL